MRRSAIWRLRGFLTRRGSDRRRPESGDTLIEVLVAVVIIGLTAVALMGTLTTTITSTAEYRSLATVDTVLKNFAEAIKDEVQLAPAASSIYSVCATTYRVVSEYPTSVGTGAGVTVFGTGFSAGQSVSSITVGTTMITNFIPATLPPVATDGTISATFFLPSTIPVGTYNVTLTVGSAIVQSPIPLTVTPVISVTPPLSAVAGYHLAISSIGWWNDATSPTSGTFDYGSSAQCMANNNDNSGIQLITVQATAPNNVTDTLGMVVSDPGYSEPPGPGAISVSASAPSSPPVPGQQITFTATVSGANGFAPTGTLGWTISGNNPTPDTCSNATPTIATGSSGITSTWTCVLSAATVGAGTYTAAVSYSGDANYGPGTGSTSVSVSPFTINSIQLTGTPGLIAQGDSIAITFNAPIDESGLCSSWNGTDNQSLGGSSLLATITDGISPADDSLSLSRIGAPSGCTTINFGSLDLGSSSFVSNGNVTFSGSSPDSTKLNWNATSNTLTVILGALNMGVASPGTPAVQPLPVTLSFSSPITDAVTPPVSDPIEPSPYVSSPVNPF
jgi:type II secretory pathway pseudopilin PulG